MNTVVEGHLHCRHRDNTQYWDAGFHQVEGLQVGIYYQNLPYFSPSACLDNKKDCQLL